MEEEEFHYGISAQVSLRLFGDDGERWVTPIKGFINFYDDEGEQLQVGRISFFHIDLNSATENGWGSFDVLDHDQSTAPFIDIIQSIEDDDYDSFEHLFDDWSSNILVADRIEILPEHRNNGITAKVFDQMVRLFGSDCSLLLLKAFPLQHEPRRGDTYGDISDWQKSLALENFETDQSSALEHLTSYYERIGFTKFKTDGIMYKPI